MSRIARQRDTPTRSDLRRDDLLDRLITLVLVDGFADLSLEEMANRLRCSKSTLYSVAASKEQIIVTVVRSFFRRAASSVEARLLREDPGSIDRIGSYLVAISAELAPASPSFFADLDSFASTQEIYRDNTRFAAGRLQQLVLDAVPAASRMEAVFVGAVASQIMEAIHRGEIETATGLDDSAAYRALAQLIVAGVTASAATTASAPADTTTIPARRSEH